MGNHKNAIIRYRKLDSCFRNPGKKYFIEDLIEACSHAVSEFSGTVLTISRRQIFEDIKFMESESGYAAEIGRFRDGKRSYYRYHDLRFSIDKQPFNETEINQLQEASLILSRFEGIPLFEQAHSVLSRIQKGFSVDQIYPIVSFEQNPYLQGLSFFGDLFAAIFYKKVLEVHYCNFKGEASCFLFHPYCLKEYRNRWYVIGHYPAQQSYTWLLALDRIEQLDVKNDPFIPNPGIDWEDYFFHTIGVTIKAGQQAQKILIWFHTDAAPYVKTKPIHGTQKIVAEDSLGLIIALTIIPNYEFFQNILAFGDSAEIKSPEHLRQRMKTKLQGALDRY
ncbi:MAG: WYL domain-containing protein [Saprospiraceae bacterium]